MNWPTVSIGIPTWNRTDLVVKAIRSVLVQDYARQVEIVVADDGSTDGTVQTLRRLFGNRITLAPGEHRGIANAKNRALIGGTGEVRGILDSDDVYEPQFVRRCVETLLEEQQKDGLRAGLVYTDNYLMDGKGRVSEIQPALDWSLEEFLDTCNLRGDCWLAWWNILQETDLHDERFELEVDYDLFYQMARITNFRRVPETLQRVRSHRGRVTKDWRKAAFWHAVGLGKYGHSMDYAVRRAARRGTWEEWRETILEGYAYGKSLREAPVNTPSFAF